jgi:hypothetical protein
MPVHPIVEPADCPAAEQHLLTIGRSGVLSSRAIVAGELETLLHLLRAKRAADPEAQVEVPTAGRPP